LEGWNQALRLPFTIRIPPALAFVFPDLDFEKLALDPALKSPSFPVMQQGLAMAANLRLDRLVLPVKKPLWSHKSSMAKTS
jgi:hypothetical protein